MFKQLALFKTLFLLILLSFLSNTAIADVENGKKVAFDRTKGNCLACHVMDDGEMAGNIAPPLIVMKARFPDRAALKAQIWDATVKNSISMMPPFGKHHILTDGEIEDLLDYLYTL
ncbi:MAG TPA: sulfur oxidation c-type cytochrome SoxX [Cycloclasticus sp.]|nr:sulfur oxidation c-type cytochrome SoxX [Cycloclasticus sp.]HIL92663.1 sulfur oxidation c-type cytochrome SoxX [Cycloclasticus sp.]